MGMYSQILCKGNLISSAFDLFNKEKALILQTITYQV